MKYFKDALLNWNNFNGKTNIKSFWMFFLIFTLLGIPIGFFQSLIDFEYLNMVYLAVMLIPFIAIGFRRLNDAGINKFLFLIPFVNLILAAFPSKNTVNS